MRDPNRIDRILAKLSVAWKLQPDTRLCQLLSNGACSVGWPDYDLFYIEDEVIESALDQVASALRRSVKYQST